MSLRSLEQRVKELTRTISKLQSANNTLQKENNAFRSVQPNTVGPKTTTNNHYASLSIDDIEIMDTQSNDNHTHTSSTTKYNLTSATSISAKRPSPSSPVPHNAKRPNNTKEATNNTKPTSTNSPRAPLPTKSANKKPPPIVVSDLNLKAASAVLTAEIGKDNFSFRGMSGVNTHIITKSLGDFKKVKTLLQDSNAQHHSYTPKDEQHINIVLRHLHSSFEEADITQAITELNLSLGIEKVMRLPTKSTNTLWLIQLKAGSDAKQLLDQHFLLHQRVVFERKRKNGVAQCKNCQLIGHSARNCQRSFRCVKCTESHSPGNCPRTLNPELAEQTLPKCVNCNGDHPANFRGCPYYTKMTQRNQAPAQQKAQTPNINAASVRKGVSFADATRADKEKALPSNIFDFINKETQKYFNQSFTELRKTLLDFLPAYTKLPENQRPLALLNLAMQMER